MLGAKLGVGIAGLSMLATAGLAPVAMAHSPEIAEQIAEWRTSVQEAVTDGNYDSWSTLMHDRNQARYDQAESKITEENFALHQELQAAIEAGDKERVKELREELGIKPRHKGGKHQGPLAQNGEELKEILSNADYDGWVALMESMPEHFQEHAEINEDTFNNMLEVHELMESGDKEGAMELKKSFRTK